MKTIRRFYRNIVVISSISALVTFAGCANFSNKDIGRVLGTGGGGALGVWLGDKIDKSGNTGKIIGGVVGAGLGAMIGGGIGQYLDEQEQQEATKAANEALNSDKMGPESTKTWNSPTKNVSGGTTVTQKITSTDGKVCKAANNFITYKGQDIQTSETYCRDVQSGRWILQSA